MRLITLPALLAFLTLTSTLRAEFADAACETITFASGRENFPGYIYKPDGNGPFPVVVWVHGHADHLTKSSSIEYRDLAKLYTREGFVLFIPDRHVHDFSRSDYSPALQKLLEQKPGDSETKRKQYIENLEINSRDVAASVEWLKRQPYVDAAKLTLSGWSSGAVAGLMLAEKRKDFRAMALFSPGMTQWEGNKTLQSALIQSARKCQLPVFLIGAKDEASPDCFLTLANELKNKPGCKTQEFVHGGYDGKERNALAVNDCDAWGYDVLRFFETALKD